MNYSIEEILLRVYQKKYLKNLQFVIYIEYKINCVKLSTGKSIGEHLDAAIEERYDIDNGVLLEW